MTIIIIKRLGYTKQVMHNALTHHSPTDAQLVPKQRSSPGQLPPVSILGMMPYGTEYPCGQFGSLPWLCPLPTCCAPPAFSLAGEEKLKNP